QRRSLVGRGHIFAMPRHHNFSLQTERANHLFEFSPVRRAPLLVANEDIADILALAEFAQPRGGFDQQWLPLPARQSRWRQHDPRAMRYAPRTSQGFDPLVADNGGIEFSNIHPSMDDHE